MEYTRRVITPELPFQIYVLERYDPDWDYNENYGFVVVARSEKEARQLAYDASVISGDEDSGLWLQDSTTCEQIGTALFGIGSRIVLRDFHAA